jgi:integrase
MTQKHLYRRDATYWWRRRIPNSLVALFGRSEVRFSLRTHIPSVARHLAARMQVLTDVVFTELEQALVEGLVLTEAHMNAILRGLVAEELTRAERARALAPPRTAAEADAAVALENQPAAALREGLRLRRLDGVRPVLRATLARAGVSLNPATDDYKVLQRLAAIELIGVHRISQQREQGIYKAEGPPPLPSVTEISTPALTYPQAKSADEVRAPKETTDSTAPNRRKRILFSEGMDQLVNEKIKDNPSWERNMARKYKATKRLFIEASGDVYIDEISTEMVEKFRDLVRHLPEGHGKSAQDRRTIYEVVEATGTEETRRIDALRDRLNAGTLDRKSFELMQDSQRIQRLTPTTINLHVDRISALCAWARSKKYLKHDNPAKGVRLNAKQRDTLKMRQADTNRLPWGPERLRKLFTTTIFTLGVDPLGDALFWAPLIAAFSGMREEEILQLQTADIERVDGIWSFRLRKGPGKKFKTSCSPRDVPIHALLIEAGLLERVERLRECAEIWLFPDLDVGVNGRFSDIFTKRFGRYRQNVGVYDPSATSTACGRIST